MEGTTQALTAYRLFRKVSEKLALCSWLLRVFAIITLMSTDIQEIIDRALSLPPADKALVVDKLLSSLDQPDEAIDALWREEVEDRIRAYNDGKLKSFRSKRSSQNTAAK